MYCFLNAKFNLWTISELLFPFYRWRFGKRSFNLLSCHTERPKWNWNLVLTSNFQSLLCETLPRIRPLPPALQPPPAAVCLCGPPAVQAPGLHFLDFSRSGLWQSVSLQMVLKISVGKRSMCSARSGPLLFCYCNILGPVTRILNNGISEIEGLARSFGPTPEQCQNDGSLSLTYHQTLCPQAFRDT